MRLLTAVSLVRAQQGEPKKSRLPFGSLLFLSFVSLGSNQLPLCATTFGCSLAIALPLPVAEEGSESVRQAPVFYEGASPDGKYVGANETCRPFRAPQESIVHSLDFYRTSGVLATAVSLVRTGRMGGTLLTIR